MIFIFNGKQFFCLVILCLIAYTPVHAQRAIPELTGPVVDEAGILSEPTEGQIALLIKAHEDSTSNQLAVLTISSLEGEVLEDYSLRVARTWGLGQADKNNGVLLLVAVAERKIRIEVGYGLEGDLPDITAKRIIDGDMTPYFRQGDFDNGILLGVRGTLEAIEGTYEPGDFVIPTDSFSFRLKAALLMMCMPMFILLKAILRSPLVFWITTAFVTPFIFVCGFILYPPFGGFFFGGGVYLSLIVTRTLLKRSSRWGPIMETIGKAKPGDVIPIDMGRWSWSYTIPKPGSGGHSSSGSSGFSSGSSGFSGGGGSFGGGGASGGW